MVIERSWSTMLGKELGMYSSFHLYQVQFALLWFLFSGTPIRIERWSPPNLIVNWTELRPPDRQIIIVFCQPRTSTLQRDSESMEHNDDERSKKESFGIHLDCARDAPGSGRSEESNAKGAAVWFGWLCTFPWHFDCLKRVNIAHLLGMIQNFPFTNRFVVAGVAASVATGVAARRSDRNLQWRHDWDAFGCSIFPPQHRQI